MGATVTKALLYELGKSISFGRLPLKAKVLWPMLLASSDDQGRGLAESDAVKWHVCPNVNEIEITEIPELLGEMAKQGMIYIYQDGRDRRLYQVIRWWEFQQHTWARPSRYTAPENWIDRARYQAKGGSHVTHNWDHPGGFVDTEAEPTVDLPSQLPSSLPSPLPSPEVGPQLNLTKPNSTKPNKEGTAATAAATPRTKRSKKDNGPSPPSEPTEPTEHQGMFSALAAAYRIDARKDVITDKQRGRLNSMSKRLRAGGYTAAEVTSANAHWWREDWRGKKGGAPTDSQFLETLTKLRAESRSQAVTEAAW